MRSFIRKTKIFIVFNVYQGTKAIWMHIRVLWLGMLLGVFYAGARQHLGDAMTLFIIMAFIGICGIVSELIDGWIKK